MNIIKRFFIVVTLIFFTVSSFAGTLVVKGQKSGDWSSRTHIYRNIDAYKVDDNIVYTYIKNTISKIPEFLTRDIAVFDFIRSVAVDYGPNSSPTNDSTKWFKKYSNKEAGLASWYGPGFHGKTAANGKPYDQNELTCAHKTRPLNSFVIVTNTENNKSLRLKVTDRGPYINGRIIDLSKKANDHLNCHLCKVEVTDA